MFRAAQESAVDPVEEGEQSGEADADTTQPITITGT